MKFFSCVTKISLSKFGIALVFVSTIIFIDFYNIYEKPNVMKKINSHISHIEIGVSSSGAKVSNNSEDPPGRKIKILLWNKSYKTYSYREGNLDFHQCPISNCYITYNQNASSDAVIFMGMGISKLTAEKLRHFRTKSKAIFIYQVREPPSITGKYGDWTNNFYNLTMTYRHDSDINNQWAKLVLINKPSSNESKENSTSTCGRENVTKPESFDDNWMKPVFEDLNDYYAKTIISNKSKNITWIVSNCKTHSKREDYVKKLEKFIKIETFGKCSGRTISTPAEERKKMYQDYLQESYFYLSFENSENCTDYITEKFYYALNSNAVPIVFGTNTSAYSKVAPKFSYIHSDDFKSPEKLAEYLLYLIHNPSDYIKYFWWKKYYVVSETDPACNVCKFLNEVIDENRHDLNSSSSKYNNFNKYWWDGQCNKLEEKSVTVKSNRSNSYKKTEKEDQSEAKKHTSTTDVNTTDTNYPSNINTSYFNRRIES